MTAVGALGALVDVGAAHVGRGDVAGRAGLAGAADAGLGALAVARAGPAVDEEAGRREARVVDVDRAAVGPTVVVLGDADDGDLARDRNGGAESVPRLEVVRRELPRQGPARVRLAVEEVGRAGGVALIVIVVGSHERVVARHRHGFPELIPRCPVAGGELGLLGPGAVARALEDVHGAGLAAAVVVVVRGNEREVTRHGDRDAEEVPVPSIRGRQPGLLLPCTVPLPHEDVGRARELPAVIVSVGSEEGRVPGQGDRASQGVVGLTVGGRELGFLGPAGATGSHEDVGAARI